MPPNKRAQVLITCLVIVLLGAFFVPLFPVQAQSPTDCSYPRVWDFSTGDYAGWTIDTGTVTADGVESEAISGSTKVIDMSLMCAAPVGNPRQFLYGYWSSHGWTAPRPYNLYLLDENGDQIGGALGGGSGAAGDGWFGTSGNWSAVYGFRIYYERGISETFIVHYFEINHTTPVPTNTPGPTSTPTPTATPFATPLYVSFPYTVCTTFTQDQTFFRGGWEYNNALQTEDGLLMANGASAVTEPSINPNIQYKFRLRFLANVEGTGKLQIAVGGTYFEIQIIDTTPQEIDTDLGLLVPYEDRYRIRIDTPLENEPYVRLEYACLIPTTTEAGIIPVLDEELEYTPESCFSCQEPEGDILSKIVGMIGWIWCQIKRFLECWLGYILRRVFLIGITTATILLGFGKFFFDAIGGFSAFISSIGLGGADYLGSGLRNIGVQIGNGITDSTIGSVINQLGGGVRDLPTALYNLFGGLFGDAYNLITTGADLGTIIIGLIGITINGIVQFLSLAPLILQSLVDGINGAALPLSYTPACINPNDLLYAPCLGFYVLDNTIFQGPAFYLLPVLMGLLAFDTFIWALNKIRDSIDG